MKPNEFDNLIRSKFDENDFEYNPGNWEQLVARMDDKPGKRRTFMWVPMAIIASTASIAASLAMIITIPALMHHKAGAPIASVRHHDVPAKSNAIADLQPTFVPVVPAAVNDINNLAKTFNSNTNNRKDNSLSLRAAYDANAQAARTNRALLAFNAAIDEDQVKIEDHSNYPVYNTFYTGTKPETRNAKTTLSIAGGLNYGNSISGYSIGATGKRMLGDHFYIESDVAFVNDNTTERSEYWVANVSDSRAIAGRMISNDFSTPSAPTNMPSMTMPVSDISNSNNSNGSSSGNVGSTSTPVRAAAAKMVLPVTAGIAPAASANSFASYSNRPSAVISRTLGNNNAAVRRLAGAKVVESGSGNSERVVEQTATPATSSIQEREVNYNMYYAQVTPTFGYNIHKKISVGVGADVQRLLMSEVSTTSGSDASQVSTREVPAFDLGLVGKAECALSNTIKAGVSYRQGMNNVVAPNANYLDRNYVQVQLKFLLLKK